MICTHTVYYVSNKLLTSLSLHIGCSNHDVSIVTLTSRVYCCEVIICMGTGDNIVWSFIGVGSTPIPNTATRYVNVSIVLIYC